MRGPCLLSALFLLAASGAHAAAQRVEVLSTVDAALRPTDAPNAGSSFPGQLGDLQSADGRFVVFQTSATNLSAAVDDLNGVADTWLIDRDTSTKQLVSRRAGNPARTANRASRPVAISRNGARVLFLSSATDLIAGQNDDNDAEDLFLFDRLSGSVTLVSRRGNSPTTTGNGATLGGLLDETGQRIVFRSLATDLFPPVVDTNGLEDVWFFDTAGSGSPALMSSIGGTPVQTGPARSRLIDFSRDGRFITLLSANALLTGQATTTTEQVFLVDRLGARRMLSHAAGQPLQPGNAAGSGGQFNDDDARFIAFASSATNLVAGLSDTNLGFDIFLHDRIADTTKLVTFAPGNPNATATQGGNTTALLSADGSRIALTTNSAAFATGVSDGNAASGAGDVYVQELASGTRTLVSRRAGAPNATSNGGSLLLDFDREGKRVLLASTGNDLVTGQVDGGNTNHLFLFDAVGETTTLVSHVAGQPLVATPTAVATGRLSDDGMPFFAGPDALDSSDDNAALDLFFFADKSQRSPSPMPRSTTR